MSIIGIVCEYNPFHSGHEYQIAQSVERLGPESTVLCVMSGDFVQRGEAAAFSKYARAEAACRCGADVVIELPLPWCLSSAEGFASGAVSLLSALGAQHLCFGSESGNLSILEEIAQCIMAPDFQNSVKTKLQQDASLSYAMARQQVLENKLGTTAKLIAQPNNILAVEYLRAMYDQRLDIKPLTIKREGSEHDGKGSGKYRSAAELRRMMMQGADISPYVPAAAFKVLESEWQHGRMRRQTDLFDAAILSRLRMFDESYFSALPDAGDGAGQRLYKAVREEPSLDSVVAAARTKRYPMSRIRRMCMCAALGVRGGMSADTPPYARVLAANEKGRELLRSLDGNTAVPIVTKPASVKQLGQNAQSVFAIGASAHDLFVLGYTAVEERKGGNDWRTGPRIV